jgi:hypothetical protein
MLARGSLAGSNLVDALAGRHLGLAGPRHRDLAPHRFVHCSLEPLLEDMLDSVGCPLLTVGVQEASELRDTRQDYLRKARPKGSQHLMPRARAVSVSYFNASCTPTSHLQGKPSHVVRR